MIKRVSTQCHLPLSHASAHTLTPDLRHANLHSSPTTSPARPRAGPGPEQDPAPPPRLTPRPVPAPQEYYTPPADVDTDSAPSSSAASRAPPALPSRPAASASTDGPLVQTSDLQPGSRAVGAGLRSVPPPIPARPSEDEPEVTRVNFRAERPMPSGVSSAIASGLASKDSPRSKVGVAPGYEDRCQGCGKRVYAAEQVFAIGHK